MAPTHTKPCCGPSADPRRTRGIAYDAHARGSITFDAVKIPGGEALIGTHDPQLPDDGESPIKRKKLKPFRMAPTAVTNAEFAAFIDATGYVTEAERFGWSFVFWSDVPKDLATEGVLDLEWWRRVDGATWYDICGPGTHDATWHPDHPVVQVSWADAQAYARWAGGRLPTEAEWEHAARGGLGDVRFPWGMDEPDDTTHTPCNIWQGQFPRVNTGADGWRATAPAQSFEPNGYGLYNCVGNVWEWTADMYRVKSLKKRVRQRTDGMKGYRLLKGGSFLCHRSYCYRYRIAARTGNAPDTATTHQGFRMVWDV